MNSIPAPFRNLVLIAVCAACGFEFQCATTTVNSRDRLISRELASVPAGPRKRVAVADFENKTIYGKRRLGDSSSDILVSLLQKTGRFIIIERARLKSVIEEQQLRMSGLVDAVTVGSLLGADALLTGSVSQFGVKTTSSSVLLGDSKTQTAEATVDIRAVDVTTGKVILAETGSGKAAKSTGKFMGVGTSGAYDETIEGEALRTAIANIVVRIVAALDGLPWTCQVAQVDGSAVVVDAGQESNLPVGTVLKVSRRGKEVRNQTTGELIGIMESPVCELETTEHFGTDGSFARVVSGQVPAAGDICRLK